LPADTIFFALPLAATGAASVTGTDNTSQQNNAAAYATRLEYTGAVVARSMSLSRHYTSEAPAVLMPAWMISRHAGYCASNACGATIALRGRCFAYTHAAAAAFAAEAILMLPPVSSCTLGRPRHDTMCRRRTEYRLPFLFFATPEASRRFRFRCLRRYAMPAFHATLLAAVAVLHAADAAVPICHRPRLRLTPFRHIAADAKVRLMSQMLRFRLGYCRYWLPPS